MEKQAALRIYKASAGSGKTYRLVLEYLKLIIGEPFSYLNILAVTFTNKATAEMKTRILTELFGLAKGLEESYSYSKIIAAELKEEGYEFSLSDIRSRAQLALNLLLHDYSRFRIETIDSFFQVVLRNLAKELGLGAYMNIELDTGSVLKEAVKVLLGRIKDEPELLEWISGYIDDKIADGNSWRLNRELEEFGKNIFREDFKEKERELHTVLQDKRFLKKFRGKLVKIRDEKIEEVCSKALLFREEISKYSLSTEDFYYGATGVAGYFNKIIDKKDIEAEMNTRTAKCLESPESWVKKDIPHTQVITDLADKKLMDILRETEEVRKRNLREINTCNLVLRQINSIGLLTDIAAAVREINADSNRFMLADTPNLLQELIKEEDAPFIYEKIGASLRHIMIDEFQDTSRIQWKNFKPLLLEGLSQNAGSLIVGDQKQSIYRWRNGDWRTLGNLQAEMPEVKTEEISLKANWRSSYKIVRFNNSVFKAAIKLFPDEYGELTADMYNAYADVEQEFKRKEEEGSVKVAFIYGEDNAAYKKAMLDKLIENIETLQENGVAAENITILVRKNKIIPLIAEYLAEYRKEHPEKPYRYEVISDQAYKLDASQVIHLIIEALRYVSEPQNEMFRTQLFISYQAEILDQDISKLAGDIHLSESDKIKSLEEKLKNASLLPLYELVEEIYRILDLAVITEQESYLYSFLDGVNEFLGRKSSDINLFLEYWDETLKNKTIPFSSEVEGMRIMSVHKSKGLEFHTVIIPFCDWTLTHEPGLNPLLWSPIDAYPFSELPLFPVQYGKQMENSFLNNEFVDETVQLWVDNLNLLYVALTRARNNLVLIGKDRNPDVDIKKKPEEGIPKTVSDLLRRIIESPVNAGLYSAWDEENREFISGNICIGEEEKKKTANRLKMVPSVLNFPYRSYYQKARFKQSNRSRAFIEEKKEFENTYISRGKLLHYLFSNIKSLNDIKPAVNELFYEGLITNEEEKEMLIKYVSEAVELPEVKEWFSPDAKIINESDILFTDESGMVHNKRPDRVIRYKDKWVVVDLKSGKEYKEHIYQVREYMELLKNMGYPAVTGYLWYIDQNRISKVDY
jgi:ATP-dependent exoDNAse (exonuclease V) beta subunit